MRRAGRFGVAALLLLSSAALAFAQDERRVLSPDGKIAFRILVAPQEGYALSRLAYQVDYRGKRLIDTSYMGVDLWDQEPLLGENTGLIGYRAEKLADYNTGFVSYMQNGSLGRRIDVEIRVYNGGVAFRYTILRSAGVQDLLIADEATEFVTGPIDRAQPGGGWLAIHEISRPGFPALNLERTGDLYLTRLERSGKDAKIAFSGTAPCTFPWRAVIIGPDEKCIRESKLLKKLTE